MLAGRSSLTSSKPCASLVLSLTTFLWICGFLAISNVRAVTSLSLDKLSLERNELGKEIASEVTDDMMPQPVATNGNNEMYVLLPVGENGIDKNTIDEAELESALNGGDMLMMETDESPMVSMAYQPEGDFEGESVYASLGSDNDSEVTEETEQIPDDHGLVDAIYEAADEIDDTSMLENQKDAVIKVRNETNVDETEEQEHFKEFEIDRNSETGFIRLDEEETTKPVADVIAEAIRDIERSPYKDEAVDSVETDAVKDVNDAADVTKDEISDQMQEDEDGIMDIVMGKVVDAVQGIVDAAEAQKGENDNGDESAVESLSNASVSEYHTERPIMSMSENDKAEEISIKDDQPESSQIKDSDEIKNNPEAFIVNTEEVSGSQAKVVQNEMIEKLESGETAPEKTELFQNIGQEFEDEFLNEEEMREREKIEENQKVTHKEEILHQEEGPQQEENAMEAGAISMPEEQKLIIDNESDRITNKPIEDNENIEYTTTNINTSEGWKEEHGMVVEHKEELKTVEEGIKAAPEYQPEEIHKVEEMKNTQREGLNGILEATKQDIPKPQGYKESTEEVYTEGKPMILQERKPEDIAFKDPTNENITHKDEKIEFSEKHTEVEPENGDENVEAGEKLPVLQTQNQDLEVEKDDQIEVETLVATPETKEEEMKNVESDIQTELAAGSLKLLASVQQQEQATVAGMQDEVQVVYETNAPTTEETTKEKEEYTVAELTPDKTFSSISDQRDDIAEIYIDKAQVSAVPQNTESHTMLTTIVQIPKQQEKAEQEDEQLTQLQGQGQGQVVQLGLDETGSIAQEPQEIQISKKQQPPVSQYQPQPETAQPSPQTQSQPQPEINEGLKQQLQQQKQQLNEVTTTTTVGGDMPLPLNVVDSVLNYVNASFVNKINNKNKQPDAADEFNTQPRRYEGAQVWRIVVQNDKDKKMADELRTKYDGQLWKEVKAEVDYLLKPNVLTEAEQHIRRANLSRIVLIDNLQKVIEVENPPAEEIAQYQNRKGHRLTWRAYHRLDDIHGFIDYLGKTYPDICQVETIGYSIQKRPLKLLKISNGNSGNPSIWIDGGMHAREWISPAAVTFVANQIVEGWDDLPDYMKNINWFIHAVANPDGYEYSHTTDRLWRKNMRSHGRQCPGVDLNRNFGYKWGGRGTSANPCAQTYRGNKAFSEPETFYISKFISNFPRQTFQAYLSFHSYGQYILYPWGYDYQQSTDQSDLDRVARHAGSIITKNSGAKYTVGASATTLYPAAGGSDDWAKGIAGIKYSYTIEMGDTGRYGFVLPAGMIENNGNDAFTFVETVARAVTKQNRSNRKRALSRYFH